MEIAESIYEGVVIPSYKKTTRSEVNHTGISSDNRGESASSNTHPTTEESTVKRRKIYVYRLKSESRTCLVHGVVHSSHECKVLRGFVIIMLNEILLRTTGKTLYQGKTQQTAKKNRYY